jgi:site-specific DNA-methyltransferase (adenine-specific)
MCSPADTRIAPVAEHPFFRHNEITIYNRDFLALRSIPEDSIDLIVTSPPYNLGISYGAHDDGAPYGDYLQFTRNWIARCYDLAKNDGRLCLNIPLDRNKKGHQSVYADVLRMAKDAGWNYRTTIVWNKQVISQRFSWGTWMSAVAPCVIAPVEMIVMLYKRTWKRRRGTRRDDVTRDEFLAWTNGLWTFRAESKKRIGHPAPFPVELPRRCLKLFSFVGDTVLDPFLGSGTTLVACALADRVGIGVEIDRGYCELAKCRLGEVQGDLFSQPLEVGEIPKAA